MLLSPVLRVVVGAISVALLVLVVAAGLVGDRLADPEPGADLRLRRLLAGDAAALRAAGRRVAGAEPVAGSGDGVAYLSARAGGAWRPPFAYPERLGVWPAAALLISFVALELAYKPPDDPRAVAVAALVYSWITWSGAAAFGRTAWFENGDGFSAYFGLFARMAAFGVRKGEVVLRAPFSALAKGFEKAGTVALVAVVLGSVAFDGLSRTNWWEDRTHTAAKVTVVSINLLGLLGCIFFAASTYLAAVALARRLAGTQTDLRTAFVGSLVPIGFAYLVAHYFSLFVLQGQYVFPLASDPFGDGWDLFGTKDYVPDLTILEPATIWYVQVGALIVGHVLGLVIAHDRALSLFSSVRSALRAQYAMLGLMVRVHGRRDVDPVPPVSGLLAHGGVGGLAVELASAIAIIALGLAVWVGNRRDRSDEDP